jgi:transposase
VKQQPDAAEYRFKVAGLARLERLCAQGHVDLFYGDESGVSLQPCVPYGWQFQQEQVFLPSTRGKGVNCFALLNRNNECWFRTTEQTITAGTVRQWLDVFAHSLKRLTVIVLDNAPVHQAGEIQRCRPGWQERGLYVFYLPAYSPHLNIAEVLWRKLKYEWLRAEDYADKETLCYQVRQALATVGKSLKIAFGDFRQNIN